MVAEKVKSAMGFPRSPATPRPCSTPTTTTTTTGITTSSNQKSKSSGTGFSRYFPRTASAQVQPRLSSTPTVNDLLRLISDLQEKESRLKTELLEQKILKETVSIVPFLEKEISAKTEELEATKKRVVVLELENEELKLEVEKLQARILMEEESVEVVKRIEEMEGEIEELKRAVAGRCGSKGRREIMVDQCSSSKRAVEIKSSKKVETEQRQVEVSESLISAIKSRTPRVPRPPPTPTCSSSSSLLSSSSSSSSSYSVSSSETPTRDVCCTGPMAPPPPPKGLSAVSASSFTTTTEGNGPPLAPPQPPPPHPASAATQGTGPPRVPPPPPPPPPARGVKPAATKVRRVPEVVEFYHSLMRRDSKRDSTGGGLPDATVTTASNAKDMIGEIENRSAYLLAIKTEVETQGDFIRFLIKEVENAAFTNIEDVVAFVKWLDDELSFLVDERAVLKHFEWPEKKADAMREAAFGYSDLKKLVSEASSLKDDAHQNCTAAMKKMQALLEKLEHGIYNLSRAREAAMKRYKGFRIPWEWMLDTGLVSQIKLASVKLAMKYMKRVSAELEVVCGSLEEEELLLQGVRFAFRVHQFAGGFDVETMRAFQELRSKASCCHQFSQNHDNEKLVCRSSD